MFPKIVKIKKIISENRKIKTFVLDAKIKAVPGQYLMIWLPTIDEKPFSIAASSPLTISVANVGPFSNSLHNLKVGDLLGFRGPFGRGFIICGRNILLVAGGYGAVPLYFLALEAVKKRKKIITLLGVKKKNDILYENKFKKLGAKILVTSEDGSYGAKGLLTEHVADIIKKGRISAVYSCGPEKMMDTLGKICESLKVPCYLSVERFMKCGGLGLCGQCEINGVLVCQDGPVFDYQFLKKLPDFGCFKRDKSGAKTAI